MDGQPPGRRLGDLRHQLLVQLCRQLPTGLIPPLTNAHADEVSEPRIPLIELVTELQRVKTLRWRALARSPWARSPSDAETSLDTENPQPRFGEQDEDDGNLPCFQAEILAERLLLLARR